MRAPICTFFFLPPSSEEMLILVFFYRARSIYERALDVDYRNPPLWIKYAELEMKNKFVNHARNIWDRAVTLLPRVDLFW
jgi:crooked neck